MDKAAASQKREFLTRGWYKGNELATPVRVVSSQKVMAAQDFLRK